MSETVGRGDPGRTREETRHRILEAALELFGTVGFDGTTVRQISTRVGITDAALYYYFKSKREILNAIWDLPISGSVRRAVPERPLTASDLDAITDAVLDFCIANDNVLRLMCREILSDDETALALRQQNRSVLKRTLLGHFKTVCEPHEAEIRSETVMGLLTGVALRVQMTSGREFAVVASNAAFRARTKARVRAVARLSEPASA